MDADERIEYIEKTCRQAFVIGWLKQTLVGTGMSRDEAQRQIDQAEAEYTRLMQKEG